MDPNMVAGQNLYSLTSSPEFQQLLFQQLQEGNRQLKEEIAILKELKELKARIAILEGRLRLQHRNTPSCPLPLTLPPSPSQTWRLQQCHGSLSLRSIF